MTEIAADLVPFAQISAAGLLLAVVFFIARMISRGDWVPRRELDYLREDRDARVREANERADDWKAAHATSEHARELQAEQNRDLLEQARTTNHLIQSLREVGARDRNGDAAG